MSIKVLIVPVDADPEVREVQPDLATMQEIVGGYLEGVGASIDDDWHAYANEEGRLLGLPVNRTASLLARSLRWPGDFLVGTVVFFGSDGSGDEADVPDRLVTMATGGAR